jgi:hypothetical protein
MRVVPTYEQLEAEVLTLRDRLSSVEEALRESDYHLEISITELRDREKHIEYLEYVVEDLKAG